ncbi:hypothetical protein QZH41_008784 [Actinostola sp. cb2023]|nr:hypothetical protein QZH41_008784 [Actinostola sp. cb2023]
MDEEIEKHFRYVFDPLRKTSVRMLQETPTKHRSALHITNLQEEKEKFLQFGTIPKFKFTGSIEHYSKKKKTSVRFDLLPEAKMIIERVRQQFGSGDNFLDISYGKKLNPSEASEFMMRMNNDGLQPWFSNRQKFGLRPSKSYCGVICEEGLAAINTTLQSHVKLLWAPALLYYTACMAQKMTFKELFDHLGLHVCDFEQRFKLVMRVKRLLVDCNAYGGSGQDQCYFEGAVRILRDTHDIDFKLLYAGRICTDELARVRRIARRDCLRFPYFLKDVVSYKRILSDIAVLNGLTQNVKRPISCRSRVSSRNKNKKRKSPNKFRILSSPTRTKTLPMMPHPPLLRSRHSQFCKLDDNF